MKSFDQVAAKNVHDEIIKELAALGKRIGVEFSKAGGKWDFTEMNLKIRVIPADKEVVALEEKRDFVSYSEMYGFKKEDYLREYDFRGDIYLIVGFNLSKPKFAVKAKKKSDGTICNFPTKQVRLQFYPEKKAEILAEVN